ncbi:MAG TPA: TonB-dependent receptor plug domain-containing protein, partial [Vicinamibacterales bacterium]|nr:TonB-dependent receptor plug domain-containing protein [Vicinamibacterales bacterium]
MPGAAGGLLALAITLTGLASGAPLSARPGGPAWSPAPPVTGVSTPPPQPATGAAHVRLEGVVLDSSGAAVPDARVTVGTAAGPVEGRTDATGRFALDVDLAGPVRLVVRAPGFADTTAVVTPADPRVRVVLLPAGFSETITVTAARSDAPRLESPASTTVLTAPALLSAAALAVDDALREVPGFSLFRRSSSRVANPTAQGASLRGMSASGASRTLVLADGVPLNDPFGGWVYWNRIPLAALDRVEVVRGAASELYGSDALGGVIQLFTREPSRRVVHAIAEAGGLGTSRLSAYAGGA